MNYYIYFVSDKMEKKPANIYVETARSVKENFVKLFMNVTFFCIIFYMIIRYLLEGINYEMKRYRYTIF